MGETAIETALHNIEEAARRHGLALFLGAGINGGLYPLWEVLVDQLLDKALGPHMAKPDCAQWLKSKNKKLDLYAQATLAKRLLGDNYTEVLRSLIYKRNPRADVCSHVDSIARFCCLPEVKAVVTYNYDTHLEAAYKRLEKEETGDREMVSVGLSGRDSQLLERDNRLVVYHVHGLLAPPEELHIRDDPVVLAYDEYSTSMRDALNWANAAQIHCLRSRTCLFLGHSMSDWNVLRLLEAAHSHCREPRHWMLTSRQECEDASEFILSAKATLLEAVGVQSVCLGNLWTDIYSGLDSLNKMLKRKLKWPRKNPVSLGQ